MRIWSIILVLPAALYGPGVVGRSVDYSVTSGAILSAQVPTAKSGVRIAGDPPRHRSRDRYRDDDEDSAKGDRLTFRLQRELQRVGCYDGEVDGDWGDASRRALERFARRTGTRLDLDQPTRRALARAEEAEHRVCR